MRFSVLVEPRERVYRDLLDYSRTHCARFSLVQRPTLALDESGSRVRDSLSPHCIEERNVSQWPGTKLLAGALATLRIYTFNDVTHEILASVSGLYAWCQPENVEDLTLWRSDKPWLVTIAHERDAYFEITTPEREALTRSIPILSLNDEFQAVMRLAATDSRTPKNVKDAVRAFEDANTRFNKWAVKDGKRLGKLEAAVFPVLDRDDEVVRAWERYDATPTTDAAHALVVAIEETTAVRLRLISRA